MALPTMQYQQELAAQRFANALYDMQLGSETLDYVLDDFATYGQNAVLNSYFTFTFGDMALADVTETMLANMNAAEGTNGIDETAYDELYGYVYNTLNAADADSRGEVAAALVNEWAKFDSPVYAAAIADFNAEVDTAMQYTGAEDVVVGTDTVVTDFYLTAGQDILVGTAQDDFFDARLSQNAWAGGVSNTLSSSDSLDGGAGDDVLNADLVPEFFGASGDNMMDIQPRIQNIETIQLEAKDYDAENDEVGNIDAGRIGVIFDAKDVTDVENIGSYYSDGDLWIENLTTLTSDGSMRNTDAITITMDHTDNFNHDEDASDLTVLFDEDYLLSGQTAESFVEYYLLDQDADMNDTDVDGDGNVDLLANINANGIRFTVDGGEEVVLTFDTALLEDGTVLGHQDFVDALQAPLQDLIDAGLVPADTTLTLDASRNRTTFLDDGSVSSQIPAILIQTETAAVLDAVGFAWVEDMVGDYNVYGRMNDDATVSNEPVAVNVDLHKVGRDNAGGDLFIGGKHDEGIPNIHIDVLGDDSKPSNLGSINTNYNDLQNVYISTHADYVSGETFASLTVRDGFDMQNSVNLVDADNFLGDLTLGSDNAVDNLVTLTAQGGGDVFFAGDIDIENVYTYTTGGGEDVVDIDLDTDAIDTIDTGLTINTNAGDDVVVLAGTGAGSQLTMEALDNVHINTGAGEDYVYVIDEVRTNIHAGTGSDFVEFAGGDDGEWNFGQATGPQLFGERVLYQAELTVTFAGFESTVSVDTDANGNFVADQMIINAAIADAIAQNPELDRLLDVAEGDGYQQITVSSLIGGENDLRVEINQPEMVTGTPTAGQVQIPTANFNQLVQGIIDTTALDSDALTTATAVETAMNSGNNFGGANFNGNIGANGVVGADYQAYADGGSSDGGNANYSVINMGSGSNDLLVLDSNDSSANVIVIDQSFGKVSVVNFHDDSPNDVTAYSQVGNHALDFTSFLNNEIDPSATPNTQSKTPIAVTLNTNAQLTGSPASTSTALANSVNMLNFDGTVTNSISFANLTAANLVDALNGTAGTTVTGGLADSDLDAVTNTTDLIGNVQDHIVMVENDQNVGEYKVFYLTSTVDTTTNTTDGDFDAASAQLLGTMDFGNSINFQLVGSEAWDDLIEDLLYAADVADGHQVDTTAPDAPALALADDTGSSDSDLITMDGELSVTPAEEGGTIMFSLDETTWVTDQNTLTLVEGEEVIYVRQIDASANVGATASITFTLDNTAPALDGAVAQNEEGDVGPVGDTVVFTFNEEVTDLGTVTADSTDGGTLAVDGMSATFILNDAAAAEDTIELVGVADVAGNTANFDFTVA